MHVTRLFCPPLNLVGEGGRGMRGQKAWECSKPRVAPQNSTLERKGAGVMRERTQVDFLASSCAPSSVSGIRTPRLPLLPLWEKGAGG
jgi:hypothetical protein